MRKKFFLTLGLLLALFTVYFSPNPVYAAGSDSVTPYTVTSEGLFLNNGDAFPDNGHVNIRYVTATGEVKSAGIHFESLNNQPSGVFIGQNNLPWKNLIPYDSQSPFVTSGIRLGSPALTTRGMKGAQMRQIARLIDKVLSNLSDDKIIKEVKEAVDKLTKKFPIYKGSILR